MKLIVNSIFILVLLFSFQCKTHKDETLDKAIFSYAINCANGIDACRAGCAGSCNVNTEIDPITNSLYPCISTCHNNCSVRCDLSNLLLILRNQ